MKGVKGFLIILSVSLAGAAAGYMLNPEAERLIRGVEFSPLKYRIGLEEAKAAFFDSRYLWLDARSEEEYRAGHIPGAESFPVPSPPAKKKEFFAKVSKDRLIITYCVRKTCPAAKSLAMELRYRGYKNCYVYTGGWEEWKNAGLPVESSGEADNE
jgi:rhodanese-related sulfurtransferase